ncbi:hypothetical protein MMC11_001772 [Xylographa trunciseda]|nr:hypothetical protein [Xylographa trunciseda]
MSLAFSLFLLLPFDIISPVLAGPQSSVCLSPYLSDVTPTCAQSCLENFIATSFPLYTCPDQQDLSCLCTSNSASGLTLGEGALQCIAAACTNPQASDFVGAYEVCAGVPNALPMTHGTLTATLATPTPVTFGHSIGTTSGGSIISLSTTAGSSSSIFPSSLSSGLGVSMSSSSPTGLLTASGAPSMVPSSPIAFTGSMPPSVTTSLITTIIPTSTPAFSAAAASSTAASTPRVILTNAQVAGIAVAGAATLSIAFGVLFFWFCMRKKRGTKRYSGSSFGGDQIIGNHFELPSDTNAIPVEQRRIIPGERSAPDASRQLLGVPSKSNDRRFDGMRMPLGPEAIGVAIASDNFSQDVSPVSVASYRTTSRLLPEKPNYNLFPSPRQPSMRPQRPANSVNEAPDLRLMPPVPPGKSTRQGVQQMDTSQAAMQAYPDSNKPRATDPFLDDVGDPRAMMYAMEQKRASRAQLPRIITPNSAWNAQTAPSYFQPPQRDIMKLATPPALTVHSSSHLKPIPETTNSSIYSAHPPYLKYNSQSSIQSQLLKSTPYRSKSGGKRPLTHYTSGSDTDFEEDGEEVDEMPPRTLGLSPVQESPNRTPLNQVRYPAVPASAVKGPRSSPGSPTRKPAVRGLGLPATVRPVVPALFQTPTKVGGVDKELPATPPIPARCSSRLSERQGSQEPVELPAGTPPRSRMDDDVTRSAKWQILCSPGLEGLEQVVHPQANVASPRIIRTVRSNDRTPKLHSSSPHIWP